MIRTASAYVFVALAISSVSAGRVSAQQGLAPNTGGAMTAMELRSITDGAITSAVRRFGRDTDPKRREDIGGLIAEMQRTVGYDTHPLKWEIVMDSSLNASAIPGGGMLINVGLSLYCDEYAGRKANNVAAAKRRAYMGCLAAVIGHEFGHLELGHTENVRGTMARRQEMQRRLRQATSITAVVRDSVLMAATSYERNQELEADRAGAVYALRTGYEVQDAIDLFDSMDADERTSRGWRNRITWTGGHPRAAERVAMLEIARGQLKLLQRDFDDALALIQAEELPDSSLAMLDRVLAAFPTLQAAQHARAVVLAQQWLAGASPAELRVRPMLPAYDARFMGQVRGASSTQGVAARRPAREAFTQLYARDAHPYTLANLAVIEAFDGDMPAALEKAALAAQRAPTDAAVLNNYAVVLFLANRNTEARDVLARAARGSEIPRAVGFNQARVALALGDKNAARGFATRYLAADRRSVWVSEAQAILREAGSDGGTSPSGQPTTPVAGPATASAPAPTVAGVDLGATRSRIIAALGEPEGGADAARNVWRYPARGIVIVLDAEATVKVIVVERREGGAVNGVTVGETWASVRQRVGAPDSESSSAQGMVYRWNRGSWVQAVMVNGGIVTAVGAQRNGQ